MELIVEQQAELLHKLENKAQFDSNHEIFLCKKNCEETAFEIAAQYEFKCPECGEMMNPIDTKKHQKNIQNSIKELKSELMELQKTI